jgi:hypothetical protein
MMLSPVGRHVAALPGISWLLGTLMRWTFRHFSTGSVNGFAILMDDQHPSQADVIDRLDTIFTLLEQTDPRRCNRIRTAVPRIIVGDLLPHQAISVEYGPAMMLDRETILNASHVWLAATVVHEGTHARFSSRSIRYTTQHRARIEHRCCAEEIDFLRRLPSEHATDVERIVAAIEAGLASSAPWYLQAEIDRNKRLARQRRRALRAGREAPDA